MVVRWKPTSRERDNTDPATRETYEKMAVAATAAIINRQWDILLTFPYFVKFKSKGFPKGMLVERTETSNTYSVKTRKLLDWLHANGYSKHDAKTVIDESRRALSRLRAMERGLSLDIEEELEHNAGSYQATNKGDKDVME
jgi:hypothetical protein